MYPHAPTNATLPRRTRLRTSFIRWCAMFAVALLAGASVAQAQTEEAKLLACDGTAGDTFGWSVAVEGDTAVIGAPQKRSGGIGFVYVFALTGGVWALQAKLASANGALGDQFGKSVALSGDTAPVSAPYDDHGTSSGSVYVFTRSGGAWTQQVKLTAADGAASDLFGAGVALSGDTVVIGVNRDDDLGADSGSAYVFGLASLDTDGDVDDDGDGVADVDDAFPLDASESVDSDGDGVGDCGDRHG
jgi:hypothetical protein